MFHNNLKHHLVLFDLDSTVDVQLSNNIEINVELVLNPFMITMIHHYTYVEPLIFVLD